MRRRPVRLFLVASMLALLASCASGLLLARTHRIGDLCASARPVETVGALRWEGRAMQVHEATRLLAFGGALVIASFAISAAFRDPKRGRLRRALVLLGAIGLLTATSLVSSAADHVPWHSIEPVVVPAGARAAAVATVPVPPDLVRLSAGCDEAHPELRRAIVRTYWIHVAGGALVALLALVLLPGALRYGREEPSASEGQRGALGALPRRRNARGKS